MVFHIQRVSQTGDPRKLGRGHAEPGVRGLPDQLGGGHGLAGVHARTCDHNDRSRRKQGIGGCQGIVGNIQHVTVRIARQPDHLDLDRVRERRMMPAADADNAAHIKQMKPVTDIDRIGHIADKALSAPAVFPEHRAAYRCG